MKKVLLFSATLLGLATMQANAQTKLIGVNTYKNDTLTYQEEYKFIGATPNFLSTAELKGGLGEGFAPKWNGADTVYSNDVLGNERLVTQITKYDAQRRPLELQYFWRNGWYESQFFTYHTNGNVASYTSIAYDSTEYSGYAYFADGRVDSIYKKTIYNAADTVMSISHYTYDANYRLTLLRDSVYNWDKLPNNYGYGTNKYLFYYANNTNTIADSVIIHSGSVYNNSYGTLERSRSNFYTYNSADTLSDSLVYYYSNNSTSVDLKNYFYNGNDVTIISRYQHDNGIDTSRRYYKTVDAATNTVTIEDYVYGRWFDGPRFDYAYKSVYDNEGYPLKMNLIDSVGSIIVGSIIYNRFANKNIDSVVSTGRNDTTVTKYVYEQSPNSIDETIKMQDVTLYPNPATNTIQINVAGVKEYDVALYNATGQMLGYYNTPKQIDITGRSAGQYFLQIIDVKSKQSVTKSVIKK